MIKLSFLKNRFTGHIVGLDPEYLKFQLLKYSYSIWIIRIYKCRFSHYSFFFSISQLHIFELGLRKFKTIIYVNSDFKKNDRRKGWIIHACTYESNKIVSYKIVSFILCILYNLLIIPSWEIEFTIIFVIYFI